MFCGVGIINYLSLFCTTSSFKICNTTELQVSSHTPKTMDNRLCVLPRTKPGLFPLSSSLEVKRNWESWVHHSFSPLPPRAMLCQKSTYLHRLHLHCLKFYIVQGGKEEVASPVLLLLYVKCPNTFDLHCKESRAWRFRG